MEDIQLHKIFLISFFALFGTAMLLLHLACKQYGASFFDTKIGCLLPYLHKTEKGRRYAYWYWLVLVLALINFFVAAYFGPVG